jgi:hypothetical protein
MQVAVITIPIPYVEGKDEIINQKVINWKDSSDRKWLTNHMHWALHNSHHVSVSPNGMEKVS